LGKENVSFVNSVTEYGNIIEFALIGIIKEITHDSKIKLIVMPNKIQSTGIEKCTIEYNNN